MYLDGQLPLGPDSSNLGSSPLTTNPAAVSNTDSVLYSVPGGGPDLVSPTLAIENGVVQTPVQQPISQSSPLQMGGSAEYGQCGSYATDGSLVSIRNRAGRGMGDCQSGPQQSALPVPSNAGLWALGGALVLVVIGLSDGGRR